MSVKYYQRAFSFQISHELRYAQIRRYLYQHVYMIRARFCFYDIYFFCSHSILSILPMSAFICPYITCLRYFGANTIWYLQFHLECDKLWLSVMTLSSFDFWCGRQTRFYYIIGGLFYLKIFYSTASSGGLFSLKLQKRNVLPSRTLNKWYWYELLIFHALKLLRVFAWLYR